jgi:hypothetical protein
MRLVLVHGINQQSKSEIIVREEMLSSMRETLGEPDRFEGVDVVAPYYGDVLAQQAGTPTISHVVAQGIGEGDDEERDFITAGLQQMALDNGVTDADIRAEESDPVVTQGLPHDRRFIAIMRAIERVSPQHGELALRILKQAFVYLKRPLVTQAVDEVVEPVFAQGPCVVVAHSLGTIVTFKLLRAMKQEVPLYVTLGSPLPLISVQSALGRPRRVPSGVKRWLNGVDPDDFVTLGKGLTAETFADGIENKIDIDNGSDAHAIAQYLRDPVICRAISDAV